MGRYGYGANSLIYNMLVISAVILNVLPLPNNLEGLVLCIFRVCKIKIRCYVVILVAFV